MTAVKRLFSVSLLLVGGGLGVFSPQARGQTTGPIGTLGGYGGSTIGSYYTNRGATSYLPYGGMMGGYVQSSGSGIGVVPQAPRRIMETPVGGASMMMYGFRDARMGSRASRSYTPFGYQGAWGARGVMQSMAGRRDMRSMPQGITYPFREPPSLTGSSMSMP